MKMLPQSFNIIPYTEIDGIRNLPDSTIMELYRKVEEDDLLDWIFYDGSVRSPEEFLNLMKFGNTQLYICVNETDTTGFFYLDHFRGKSVHVHICVFKEFMGTESMKIAKIGSHQLLNMTGESGEYLLDVLIGIIPDFNPRAQKFTLKAGYKQIGTIPHYAHNYKTNQSHPATIFSLTRD